MQLIVAEKPSVARDLARVLGVRPSGAHAFEGDGCVITWCVGHLVELDEPAAYDPRWKSWRLDTLPMLPAEFQLRPAKHAGPQLRAVVKLLRERRFRSVVNACDAGREGELIFRYVYQYAGGGPPVRRLWISSLTDDAIRRGLAALRPGSDFDALGDAARARSEADWLVGMNATRAVTARGRASGGAALYSIGRVQTPTLAMLVEREHAITAFVPRAYWELRGEFTTADGQPVTAGWRHGALARIGAAAIADEIVARDRAHGAAAHPAGPRVERVRARTVREPAPLLFDLTSLQRTANRRFGWSAARTLELAQALYERHKLLTYPRTDSRHLTSDVEPELPRLFAALGTLADYAACAAPLLAQPPPPGRRIIDDSKVHDHHAIIPTGKVSGVDALDRDARRLFDLVVRRFLGVFHPDAEFAITEAWIRVGPGAGAALPATSERAPKEDGEVPLVTTTPPMPDRYLARGRVRIAAGWQAVAGIDGGDDRDRDDAATILPALVEGQALAGRFAAVAKQTAPPPRFTEATLLGAMESAGKTIEDEALRLAMKDCGLGTPATRAAVIETLLKRDYIARERQHLRPTATGLGLIAALPVASLASPELTGSWEARLARVARGVEARAVFMRDIARFVVETVDAIRGATPPVEEAAPRAAVGRCPKCGAAVGLHGRDYACADRCGFALRARIAGRAISPELAAVLLDRKRTQVLRGFRSKAGKPFAALLVLDDAGEVRFEFAARERGRGEVTGAPAPAPTPAAHPPRARAARTPAHRPARAKVAAAATIAALTCPRCEQGPLITGARGWGCARWREGCRFVIWFATAGRTLSAAQVRDLVTLGKTRKAKFASARGEEILGRLVLDLAADGGARLEPS
jgi:DNA topoisomerase-3